MGEKGSEKDISEFRFGSCLNIYLFHRNNKLFMKIIRTNITKNALIPKKFKLIENGVCRKGDVVLAKLLSAQKKPRNYLKKNRKKVKVRKGNVFMGCISDRYAPKILRAIIPKRLKKGDTLNLLESAGAIGIVKSARPGYTKREIEFLGFVSSNGKKINIVDYSIKVKKVKISPKIIVVVGVVENSGKTLTIAGLTEGLVKRGYKVCVGKLTGIGDDTDVILSKSKGAKKVLSIIDAGWPSSVGLSKKELDEVFIKIYSNLAEVNPDFIILEIADGITQRESAMLMKSKLLTKYKPCYILSVKDPVGAYGGKILMKKKFGVTPVFFTGKGTVTDIGREEIENTTGSKAFNPVSQWDEMTSYLLKKVL